MSDQNPLSDLAKGVSDLAQAAKALPNAAVSLVRAPFQAVGDLVSGIFGSKDETKSAPPQPASNTHAPMEDNKTKAHSAAAKPTISHQPSKAITQTSAQTQGDQMVAIKLSDLLPNPAQPRKHFDETALAELAASISREGVLAPILVRKLPSGKFEIIAGERRFRAARKAGLKTVPALIRNVDNATAFELSVVENIQRQNLNPVEEAQAYHVMTTRFSYAQAEVAAKVGKSQVYVGYMLRILSLPVSVLEHVKSGKLSAHHARLLIAQDNVEALADEIAKRGLSIRETEELLKERAASAEASADSDADSDSNVSSTLNSDSDAAHSSEARPDIKKSANKLALTAFDPRIAAVEERLHSQLKTKVKVDNQKRELIISYSSVQELEAIAAKIRE